MEQDEVIKIIDQYLNERGQWAEFTSWLIQQGYKPEELGFKED